MFFFDAPTAGVFYPLDTLVVEVSSPTMNQNRRVPSILIVDDLEANRYAFGLHLRSAGFNIIEAANGLEALEKLEPKPDLILLDINLPDINGFEILKQLKQKPYLSSIPVIQTSASFVTKEDYLKGIYSGADAYLISPVDPELLIQAVKASLKRTNVI